MLSIEMSFVDGKVAVAIDASGSCLGMAMGPSGGGGDGGSSLTSSSSEDRRLIGSFADMVAKKMWSDGDVVV